MPGTQSLPSALPWTAELTALPTQLGGLLRLLEDFDVTPTQLEHCVASEPALAAAVLRTVNSAQFGLSEPVQSLESAILMLGFLKLRSLTLTALAAGAKRQIPHEYQREARRLWGHSLAVGLGARQLADRAGLMWAEEAYAAGLLHDIGRIALLGADPRGYAALMHRHDERPEALPPAALERERFGVDHLQIGGALLERWHLPEQLIVISREHDRVPEEGHTHDALLTLVMLADRIAQWRAIDDLQAAGRRIPLPEEDPALLAEEIRAEVALAAEHLEDFW